jgi:hypothetical protein
MIAENAAVKILERPVPSGWALRVILRLDEDHPGFLRFLHTASPLRRQVIFFVLSRLGCYRPDLFAGWIESAREAADGRSSDPLSVIAAGLASMRLRDIVRAVLGVIPPGLIGVLARCGHEPMDRLTYTLLHAMLDDPRNAARATLLRHARIIDDGVVHVVWRLPPALLRPDVLDQIRRPEQIDHYVSAIKLIKRLHPDVGDEMLANSLARVHGDSNLGGWLKRWMERAQCLPPALPWPGDDVLKPIVSGSEMKSAALRYRNCMGGQVSAVALGRVVYFEHVGDPGAIAEVVALSGGRWLLHGIYAADNERASALVVRSIRARLEGAGVLVAAADVQSSEVAKLAEMLGVYNYAGGPSMNWDPDLIEASDRV